MQGRCQIPFWKVNEDILLAFHFLEYFNGELGKQVRQISLVTYSIPGQATFES